MGTPSGFDGETSLLAPQPPRCSHDATEIAATPEAHPQTWLAAEAPPLRLQ